MAGHIEHDVPVRQVTSGPGYHFFGYYDKFPWDATGRYLLCLEVDFLGRTPEPDDVARLCLIDTQDGDALRVIAETRAWNWQQGCMARWLPPHDDRHVIYNDCAGGGFVSIVLDIQSGERRQLPFPVYDVSPDGSYAVAPNFARIHDRRPGYGYAGPADPGEGELCPEDDGLWRLDIATGEVSRIATIAELARLQPDPDMAGNPQWLNHVQINRDGSRVAVLHRWSTPDNPIRSTRLFTMNPDGTDKCCLAHHQLFSHYDWRGADRLLGWARRPDGDDARYVLYTDRSDEFRVVGDDVLTADGHCSFSPDLRWLLTDTYPRTEHRRVVVLYEWPDGPRIDVGSFHSPPEYQGEFRCDLHPRWSRDGLRVCIDSAHLQGRQMHVLDVGDIVGPPAG
ncbi:MAG: hypothetical protein ACOC70_01065 [bacterium]